MNGNIKIGNNDILKLKCGSDNVSKLYIGSDLVYDNSEPEAGKLVQYSTTPIT